MVQRVSAENILILIQRQGKSEFCSNSSLFQSDYFCCLYPEEEISSTNTVSSRFFAVTIFLSYFGSCHIIYLIYLCEKY